MIRTPTPPRRIPRSSRAARDAGIDDTETERTILRFPPVARGERPSGWTANKQRSFIQVLMTCGSVTRACRAVAMSRKSAYLLRYSAGAEGFARAWEAALKLAAHRLADLAYERAISGTTIPHYYKGEKVGEHVTYDTRLLLHLLRTQNRRGHGRFADVEGYYDADPQVEARLGLGRELAALADDDDAPPSADPIAPPGPAKA